MIGHNAKRRGNDTAMRILWPNLPAELIPVARDAVGLGFETDFCTSPAEVTVVPVAASARVTASRSG